jgi:hypothetical protein
MGSKGQLAGGFARLVHDMWGGDLPYLTPMDFRVCAATPLCSLSLTKCTEDDLPTKITVHRL